MAKRTAKLKIDYPLLLIIFALLIFGLVVLYSASTVESFKNTGNSNYYILHQLIYGAGLGLLAMLVLSKVYYHFWQKLLPFLVPASLLLLILVQVPGLGFTFNGATRWLKLGPLLLQPAEPAKLVIIIYLASWIHKRYAEMHDLTYGILPTLIITGLFALLIIIQPDLGTILVLGGIAIAMLLAAGMKWKHFFSIVASGGAVVYALVKLEPYRVQRLTSFFNSDFDPKGISYQINQALLAIGSGGLWGYGYSLSRQKHNYLPEVMTDSIFAVLAEELGFLRVVVVLILFALLVFQGYRIAIKVPDIFGRMMAFGIISWISIQALINLGAIVKLLPLTGIPLPFFSYGSSSLFFTLAGLGILLNISRFAQNKQKA